MSGELFNPDDRSLRGKGIDSLGNKKDNGFLFDWRWDSNVGVSMPKDGPPCKQCSVAQMGDYGLKVIRWYSHYEARVSYCEKILVSSDHDDFKNRVEAQGAAEKMLGKFIGDSCILLWGKMLGSTRGFIENYSKINTNSP